MLGYLQERFGISQTVFAEHHLLKRGAMVWLLSKDDRLPAFASLRVESAGLPLLRWVKSYLKPTSVALQVFGSHARRNIVSLEPGHLKELAEKRVINSEFPVTSGYVIIMADGVMIGCALYLPGRLISQLPRRLFTSQAWEMPL